MGGDHPGAARVDTAERLAARPVNEGRDGSPGTRTDTRVFGRITADAALADRCEEDAMAVVCALARGTGHPGPLREIAARSDGAPGDLARIPARV
ncbi:hypothetical protein PWG71_18160 [Nocardiopsis sp. N85]|uniref:hypothetical protein n=1 Tax=Nocardiopsis sp. N85 TaxID=3029400 RepID=UPI00237F7B6C|nr:hypothetical protein [Nocardiopsis sp. N85]MDE3723321.1 hypothetical protein [Nocardiopsis sp. N85]